MKKALIICVILIICIALTGCADESVKTTAVQPKIGFDEEAKESPQELPAQPESNAGGEEKSDAVKQDIEVPIETEMPVLSSEIESSISSQLNGPNKFLVRPTTLNAKIGETVVYGIGIYNAANTVTSFKLLDVQFQSATDSFNNAILAETESLDSWVLTSNVQDIKLEPYSYAVVPIYLKVQKKIGENKETAPGVYRFNIQVQKYSDPLNRLTDKYANKDFYLKVE